LLPAYYVIKMDPTGCFRPWKPSVPPMCCLLSWCHL